MNVRVEFLYKQKQIAGVLRPVAGLYLNGQWACDVLDEDNVQTLKALFAEYDRRQGPVTKSLAAVSDLFSLASRTDLTTAVAQYQANGGFLEGA